MHLSEMVKQRGEGANLCCRIIYENHLSCKKGPGIIAGTVQMLKT